MYEAGRSADDDLAAMHEAFRSWPRDEDGEARASGCGPDYGSGALSDAARARADTAVLSHEKAQRMASVENVELEVLQSDDVGLRGQVLTAIAGRRSPATRHSRQGRKSQGGWPARGPVD